MITRLYPIFIFSLICVPVIAAQFEMRDGRLLNGQSAEIAQVGRKIDPNGRVQTKSILLIDDGLRRTYVPRRLVKSVSPDPESLETFKIKQVFASIPGTKEVVSLGEYRAEPFDQFGRRMVILSGPDGLEYDVQSITEINSKYVRVRAKKLIWDARYATNSFPRAIITPILMDRIDTSLFEERMRIFGFYVRAKYYDAADEELLAIMKDFKDDPNLENRLTSARRELRRLSAGQLQDELIFRSEAGQHKLVANLLRNFPGEEVSGVIMQQIRRMLEKYDTFEKNRDEILLRLQNLTDKIADEKMRSDIEDILDEIEAEINPNTFARLSAFQLSEKDASLTDEEKIAIAITGWLAGSKSDNRRLTVAISMYETRKLVRDYLRATSFSSTQAIFDEIKKQEAGTPDLVAALLKLAKPPFDPTSDSPPDTADDSPKIPGGYEIEMPGIQNSSIYENIRYTIQLPPEYDPNRSYPLLMSLHPASKTPQRQIEFWTGKLGEGTPVGHAGRNGYIVVTPHWGIPGQSHYDYSPLVHGVVLFTLRDVCAKFNVDTDKVFLSGHAMGADAAWDIALAHPDIWAGLVLFNAVAGGPVEIYNNNAQHVPIYYVSGEMESTNVSGRPVNKLVANNRCLNHYLRNGYNVTVVEYQGRGPETYEEEIMRIFDWMKRMERTFPKEYKTSAIWPLNDFYFFWNVEYPQLPDEKSWPLDIRGKTDVLETACAFLPNLNKLKITATRGKFQPLNPTIYLTEETVNFNQRVDIEFNSKKFHPKSGYVEPDLRLILEDARTRKDRKHPFWVRLDESSR